MSLDTGDGDTQEFSPAQVGVPLPIFAHDVRLSSAEEGPWTQEESGIS